MLSDIKVSISLLRKLKYLIVILLVSFGIFVYASIKEEQFAALVNYSGKVRGDIQRLTKFYFANKRKDIPIIEKQIDVYLKEVETYADSLRIPFIDTTGKVKPRYVVKYFNELKKLINSKPSDKVREKIFKLSEICWKQADKLTDFYQSLAERNFKLLNFFYILLFLSSILIILLLVKSIIFEVNRKLEQRANFDPLTGALNRGSFNEIFNKLTENNDITPLGVIFFDLDNFKKINDFYGHAVGDEVLKKVAKKVRKYLRKTDLFVRWGGEEFAIILPYTDLKGAAKVAEKLRKAIENLKFDEPYLRVTASFGVTEIKSGENLLEALNRADKALYEAKQKGKNRVEIRQA